MKLRVTVCELPDDPDDFAGAWTRLQAHARAESSDLLVLNEAPFDRWFARSDEYHEHTWNEAVENHAGAVGRLDLDCPVLSTAPVTSGDRRHNQAFSWTPTDGVEPWRRKAYLPDEESVYEATWYHRALDQPDVRRIGGASIGVLICTELWRFEWASQLGQLGAHIIATPRASGSDSLEKWRTGGKAAAICSGAFSVSSNRVGSGFGGGGWIFSPDGEELASTNAQAPFVTTSIDLLEAEEAKTTYPRYALWS